MVLTKVFWSPISRVCNWPLSSTPTTRSPNLPCRRCSVFPLATTTTICTSFPSLHLSFHYLEGSYDQFRVFGLKDSSEPFYSLTYAVAPILKVDETPG